MNVLVNGSMDLLTSAANLAVEVNVLVRYCVLQMESSPPTVRSRNLNPLRRSVILSLVLKMKFFH